MKEKVYFVQVGVSYSSPCFLPYSVGCIVAYLKKDGYVSENYEIPDIIVMREKISDVIKRFDNPSYVAFSCYTWNLEYNKTLAAELKKKYPDVKIIFGGHSVPHNASFLDQYEFIDYLMHNEGEETTAAFLKAVAEGTDLSEVPNISYRTENGNATTEFRHPCNISSYSSPYIEGVFDNILKENPDVEFHATLETNRGCPYECAYCEWCYTKNIRQFPIDKIKAEIEWIAENKIEYCYCADANFGILDRDVEIAQYVVDTKNKYGYPKVFKPCYAKESNDNVFKAGYILNKNQIDKGVTLAYQSLNEQTLKKVGRKNLNLQHFSELYTRYKEADIPTYTELILGLPGETYESFCKGICELLESGQNNSMTVYDCQICANAEMGSEEYRNAYGIKASRIPLLGIHYNPEFNGVTEYFEIITETADMPKSDWVKSNMFSVVLQSFHHLGLLRYFALYLRYEKNVSFYDFYSDLFAYIYEKNEGFINQLFSELYDRKADVETADWTYTREVFGSTGWYFEEGAFLELVYHSDVFWDEIKDYLEGYNIEKVLFEELFVYQKALVRLPGINSVEVNSEYNFYKYFEAISENKKAELKKVKSVLSVESEKKIENWEEYAREIIWFGKRYNATLLVNPRSKIVYSEE